MKWIEPLLATALFAALAFLGRYLVQDFRTGVARSRVSTFTRADQPLFFWLVTIWNLFFFSLASRRRSPR